MDSLLPPEEWLFECIPMASLHPLLRRDELAFGAGWDGRVLWLWLQGLHAAAPAPNGLLAHRATVSQRKEDEFSPVWKTSVIFENLEISRVWLV